MATIVDELLIRLGVDASGLKAGIKDAAQSLKSSTAEIDQSAELSAEKLQAIGEGLKGLKGEDLASAIQSLGLTREQAEQALNGGNLDELLEGATLQANDLNRGLQDVKATAEETAKSTDESIKATNQGLNDTAEKVKETSDNLKEAQKAHETFTDEQKKKNEEVKKTVSDTAKEYEGLAGSWKGKILSFVRTVAAPIAGFFAIGATIQSYFSGVGEVAQMTGAYSQQLEDWQKKRALLARVNKEDIELYKKGREALLKFNFAMQDLGTQIMRAASPAIKFLIEMLNGFSDWLNRNSDNIIRFLTVAAATITAVFVPALLKMAAAMLANPLTWIIAAIGGLILVIDDLCTYLRGGQSLFGGFWEPFVNGVKAVISWFSNLSDTSKALLAVLGGLWALAGLTKFLTILQTGTAVITAFGKAAMFVQKLALAFKALTVAMAANPIGLILVGISLLIAGLILLIENWDGVKAVVASFVDSCKSGISKLVSAISGFFDSCLQGIKNGWNALTGFFGGIWDGITARFQAGVDGLIGLFDDIGNAISSSFDAAVDGIKSLFEGLVSWFTGIGGRISSFFSGLWNGVLGSLTDTITGIIDNVPAWLLPDNLKKWAEDVKKTTQAEPTDAQAQESVKTAGQTTNNANATQNNNNVVNVYTNTSDPQAVARAAQNGIMQANQASYSYMGTVATAESGVR